ncbi:MAG: DUF3365 domain-containing protein [Candidatus Competibacteraceae bacterium]|nr:DUF3365 domain-containing protein [Candidatus Competibacteraceae bacterium]
MANEKNPMGPVITNSLIKRFRKSIVWLYIITIMISIPIIYLVTQYQVHAESNKELTLMLDMVTSMREYISKDVRPDLMEAKMFQSPTMSGAVATSKVANYFIKRQPNYYIKVASDNPLNLKNMAGPFEKKLLDQYREDRKLDEIIQIGEINGERFLVSSRPSVAKKECMVCHGDPKSAPMPITSKYGTTSGYNYQTDSVVGTINLGVPLADVNTLVIQRGLVAVGIITLIFSLIFLIINTLVKRSILLPIASITEAAVVLSKGNLEQEISVKRDGSEIGELAHSFELLRRSLKWTMGQSKG